MPISLLFWLFYVLCLVLTIWVHWPFGRPAFAWVAMYILIFLLGWRVFGFVVHD